MLIISIIGHAFRQSRASDHIVVVCSVLYIDSIHVLVANKNGGKTLQIIHV